MMKRLFFPAILFLILVSQGVAIEFLPNSLASADILITPHWVFIFLLLISLLYDTNDTFFAIVYGVAFGLLIDIVYTEVLGLYMFVYPFTLYIVHLLKRFLQTNIYMAIIVAAISLLIIEFLLILVFSIIGYVDVTNMYFFLNRFIPTLIANLLFLIPAYILSAGRLRRWSKEQLEN